MKLKVITGIVLTLFLIGMLTLAFNIQPVKASGTIYIRADGSIDPPTAPIQRVGDVYTFTGNIYDSIVIERNNTVVDGAGHTLQGTGSGAGIDLTERSNVTIKNMKIKGFYIGIRHGSSSTIYGVTMTDNLIGIQPGSSNNITGNSITGAWSSGIELYGSNNSISGNIIANNTDGIELDYPAKNNTISGNKIKNNYNGISFFEAYNNTISGNKIKNNDYGISFQRSSKNTISRNYITDNDYGIKLYDPSNNNTISGNIIANNGAGTYGGGIWLHGSYNTISGNNITNNDCGIELHVWWGTGASNNFIYHNNFVDNADQVYIEGSVSVWDDGYPSGGNYWSDYAGVDLYSGPYQNETGSDGIGDTPYVIDADNRDRYPLMNPWTVSAPPELPEAQVQVGVKAGDWIKITYTITGWPAGTPYPEWLKVEFLSVEGTTATVRVTMRMSNGTEQNATVPVDIVAGGQAFGLSGFVIPANLTVGDVIFMSGYGNIAIAGETTRTYAGASRTVVYASISQYGTQLTYYWDKQTGVLVEASETSGGITATAKATETNMWEAAPPAPPTPFWMHWWLWTIVAVVIVALAGAVYFLRKRKPPTPTTPAPPTEGTLQNTRRKGNELE